MAKKRNGPVVNNGIYARQHARVNKDARAMKNVRDQGYGGLDSAIRGIYKSTLSTQKGFAQDLDRHNSRTMRKLLEHTARTRASNRRLTHATNKQLDFGDTGGMLSARTSGLSKNLKAQAKGDARAANVAGRAVGLIADTAQRSMGIQRAGTKEAAANARTLASESLSQRTNEDLALISQQHHDISMAKIQEQQQAALAAQQHEYAMKQLRLQEKNAEEALKEASGGRVAVGLMKQQINVAASVAQELYNRIKEGEDPTEILNDLVKRKLIDSNDATSGVVSYLVRSAQSDQGAGNDREHMAREVMHALEQMPTFEAMPKKQQEKVRAYVKANLDAIATSGDGGDGGGLDWSIDAASPGGLSLREQLEFLTGGPDSDYLKENS